MNGPDFMQSEKENLCPPQQAWGNRSDRQSLDLGGKAPWLVTPYWGQGPFKSMGHAQPSGRLRVTRHNV